VIASSGFSRRSIRGHSAYENEGPTFAPVKSRGGSPLDLQEVARSAAGFLQHIDSSSHKYQTTPDGGSPPVLKRPGPDESRCHFRQLSEGFRTILAVMDNLNALVETNRPALSLSVSNILVLFERINQAASAVRELVATNSPEINAAVKKNIESSTATLKSLLAGGSRGQGSSWRIALKNEQIAPMFPESVDNLKHTTSNLNRLGLWRHLVAAKDPRNKMRPAQVLKAPDRPKNPFD